jgi:hypothetical protein
MDLDEAIITEVPAEKIANGGLKLVDTLVCLCLETGPKLGRL